MHTKTLSKALATLVIALGASAPAQAQVGMTEWRAGTLPVTLVYPTQASARPHSLGPVSIDVALNAMPLPRRQRLIVVSRGAGGSALADHAKTCTLLADLPGAGHFDLLWPWPSATARHVAALQVRGGLPVPGFDAGQRDAAHAKIAAFHRQHLTTSP